MEIDEVKNIEAIKRLKDMCLRTLKPAGNKSGLYTAEIRVFDFLELAVFGVNRRASEGVGHPAFAFWGFAVTQQAEVRRGGKGNRATVIQLIAHLN